MIPLVFMANTAPVQTCEILGLITLEINKKTLELMKSY